MNLYKFHADPQKLAISERVAVARVPDLFWPKLFYQYMHARGDGLRAIREQFRRREPAIALHAGYAFIYTKYILHDRFREGEPAILKSARLTRWYAEVLETLNLVWPEGEAVIAGDPCEWRAYCAHKNLLADWRRRRAESQNSPKPTL